MNAVYNSYGSPDEDISYKSYEDYEYNQQEDHFNRLLEDYDKNNETTDFLEEEELHLRLLLECSHD